VAGSTGRVGVSGRTGRVGVVLSLFAVQGQRACAGLALGSTVLCGLVLRETRADMHAHINRLNIHTRMCARPHTGKHRQAGRQAHTHAQHARTNVHVSEPQACTHAHAHGHAYAHGPSHKPADTSCRFRYKHTPSQTCAMRSFCVSGACSGTLEWSPSASQQPGAAGSCFWRRPCTEPIPGRRQHQQQQ